MRLAYVCFFAAALHGLAGMGLGIYMGIAGDFALAPAHAHVNLLGWVTLALYGLYHRGAERAANRLAATQVACAVVGAPLMAVSLGVYLATGAEAFVTATIVGSLLTVAGMALFLATLAADLRSGRSAAPRGARPAGA
jgi:FtsH-binding integral membrane protein